MARTKPKSFIPIKHLGECDQVLHDACAVKRELAALDSEMNEAIDRIKQQADADSYALKNQLSEISQRLYSFSEYNKGELFAGKKTIDLLHGQIGFRQSTKIKQAKGIKVSQTMERLKQFEFTDGIRAGKEGINKDVLKDWTDEKLQAVGQIREVTDEFWYDLKEETVEG